MIDPMDVEKTITPKTLLVSVMHVNNEIGTVQPVAEIGKVCRKKGVYFHTDAVQGFCKLPIDVKNMNIDLLSASSHKIHGPKGVGLLYVRKGVRFEPVMHGGNHEHGKRAGTENVPGIVGFAKACDISVRDMDKEGKRLKDLRERLVKGVLRSIPKSYLNGHPEKRLAGNANFRFDGIEGEALILRLDALGIEASTGSACSSRELKPSHVLTAIGLRPEQAHGSLRISMGKETTKEDVDFLLEKLPGVIDDLRRISPFWKG
jgi:cysteine desulfurase